MATPAAGEGMTRGNCEQTVEGALRVVAAMLEMRKLDIGVLGRAAAG